jgi:hypothetical protein
VVPVGVTLSGPDTTECRAYWHKSHYRRHIPFIVYKALFTIPSNAFRTQEWCNLATDDVLRLRKTSPLVTFLVGWLAGMAGEDGGMVVSG